MYIERPIIEPNFNFVDPEVALIADTLYREVNETFYPGLNTNIIKSYRAFNDNFVPVIDFPLLKVYKLDETEWVLNSPLLVTNIAASYALAFTQPPKVGDVSTFVSREIRRVLINMSNDEAYPTFQLDFDSPMTVDYEDFINPDNVIYKYATVKFTVFSPPSNSLSM